jgi:hypothetical protein
MKILDYEFSSADWKFNKVNFQNVNLIVGDSGAGKTRLLNTMFNLGVYVAQSKLGVGDSHWKLKLEVGKDNYFWEVTTLRNNNESSVQSETIYLNDTLILKRGDGEIVFNGQTLPKLPRDMLSVSTLKEEGSIRPLYQGFSRIMRRNFFTDELEESSGIYAVNQQLLNQIGEKRDIYELYKANLGLNPKLYILNVFFPEIYEKILIYFKDAFQYIRDIAILDSSQFNLLNVPGNAPIFCIKETHVDKWVQLPDLSSGMQKALLILTDLFTQPKDGIYLIDEYENSLGVGPINLLPNLLFSENINTQIFITSHHPYIISKFPVENWFVAHRRGSEVSFSYGDDLVNKYSVSVQDKYIQLINDPLYSEGIE